MPRDDQAPTETHAEDLSLVRASLRRDPRARRQLAERMQCMARILAAKNARSGAPLDDDELADVVQDSITVFWSKRSAYEGRAALESWAYRIGIHEWMNAIRKKRRRIDGRELLARDLGDAPSTGEVTLEYDATVLIEEALGRIGDPDGDVIRRKHFDDCSFTEIGASLDVSPNTVKFWYYRGMDRLRVLLLPRLRRTSS